ncbi:MAG: hypothetical protein BWY66_00013 [bacterium ADurb.Bin374]|nr:MAG: hypothetical protein BWY66_00013 [bacterium ADurb.Bin374]
MISFKKSVRMSALLLFAALIIFPAMTAAGPAAVTVEARLGSVGTATELILCPLLGKRTRDPNWMYRTLPDGSANPAYPPVVQTPAPVLPPPSPVPADLSQTWTSWNIAQNVAVDSSDQEVPMEKILFDSVASTTAASGAVVIYVDSTDSCPHQDAYRAYLTSKGIAYTQLERRATPNYEALVGGLNYLSPGGVSIPLLLINGEPVVGKWRASTQARIDMLLKKHGLIP